MLFLLLLSSWQWWQQGSVNYLWLNIIFIFVFSFRSAILNYAIPTTLRLAIITTGFRQLSVRTRLAMITTPFHQVIKLIKNSYFVRLAKASTETNGTIWSNIAVNWWDRTRMCMCAQDLSSYRDRRRMANFMSSIECWGTTMLLCLLISLK